MALGLQTSCQLAAAGSQHSLWSTHIIQQGSRSPDCLIQRHNRADSLDCPILPQDVPK
jgi:hypothetical protein